jgi:hypothetical protein
MTDLQSQLNQFTGTETYHRHFISRRLQWTDGVEFFAKHAKAYWLIDAIAICVNGRNGPVPDAVPCKGPFGIVVLDVVENDSSRFAMLQVLSDYDENDESVGDQLWSAIIGGTDCLVGRWLFYLVANDQHVVMMLPKEY